MEISSNKMINQNYEIINSNRSESEQKDASFAEALKESQKNNSNNVNTKKEESSVEQMLKEIKKIINSGINEISEEKLNEIIDQIKKNLEKASKRDFSVDEMQELFKELQNLINDITNNMSGTIFDKAKIEDKLKDIFKLSQELVEESKSLLDYGKNSIGIELQKYQNIKIN
ncbi:hypothetical protein CRV08_00520 [Halarcobacter ebronensis]|uniref:Uncharacterized protein n=1 Tax=Halarcobacter ebronensis TaxID=1462615 RepID=A0A4Q0YHG3_9BACT|nr:hypothetical protein [Halarcobacter ebronensis]RXJ70080.1 hypothetical protein CRV08_00520 [Halarcobacter ebronensis]